jgi:hypothetical protein
VERFRALGTEAHRVYPDEASDGELFTAHGLRFGLRLTATSSSTASAETPHPFLEPFFAGDGPRPARSCSITRPRTWRRRATSPSSPGRSEEPAPGRRGRRSIAEELEAIHVAVPWTRVLAPVTPGVREERRSPDLVEHVARPPGAGSSSSAPGITAGRRVSSGQASEEPWLSPPAPSRPSGSARLARASSGGAAHRPARRRGRRSQAVVDIPRSAPLLATSERSRWRRRSSWTTPLLASVVRPRPSPAWGGVVRASASRIVNIQGGGGVLPLIEASVWERLRRHLRAGS